MGNMQNIPATSNIQPILRLDGICKNFGGVVAANHVTFRVLPGEIHGLIGPNGAGKTTLMNLISGIYTPDEGSIYLDEEDITNVPSYKRARMGIGRTFQTPRFLNRASIMENLLIGSDLRFQYGYLKSFFGKKNMTFLDELKELMSVAGFSLDLDDDIKALPYGQLKILEIVRSMLSHPRIMLVDEPAAGLNNKEIEDAMELLKIAAKEKNIGVLLIEHSMDMIMNNCENIVVINFGKVIGYGCPSEVSSNPQVIEAYLGKDVHAKS